MGEEEVTSQTSKKGEGFLKAKKQKGELDEQLREYINEWRKQRGKEEEELKRLKEKQAKRKEIRAEQEKKLAQQKKEEEERLRKEEAEKKAKEAEEKKKRLEEAEMKRQAMMQAQKEKQQAAGLSLANTHPRSACTPNTSVGLTPGPMRTGENFTKEAGKLSEQNTSKPSGRRNTMNG